MHRKRFFRIPSTFRQIIAFQTLFWIFRTECGLAATTAIRPDDVKMFYDSSFGDEDDDYFVSRVELPRVHPLQDDKQQLQRFDMGLMIYNYSDNDVWAIYDKVFVPRMGDDGLARLIMNNLVINTGSGDSDSDERHTTFSAKDPPDFSAKGCVTTYVLDNEPMVTADRITYQLQNTPGELMVIFGFTVETMSADFIDFLAQRHVIAGFLRKNRPISQGLRADLYSRGVPLLDNLAIPDNLDVTQSGITYYGYLMVFAPFGNRTSRTYPGAFSEYVNLAELTLLTATTELKKMCLKQRSKNPIILSNDFHPSERVPVFPPGVDRPQLSHRVSSNGKSYDWLTFSDHFGTHISTPYHFVYQGYSTDSLPSRYTLAPCIKVVDRQSPNNMSVNLAAFKRWEKKHNRTIPEDSLVLIETGHGKRWPSGNAYLNGYPGVDSKAAEFLVRERKIVGLGIDSPTLDSAVWTALGGFPSHLALAQNDAVALLNVATGALERFPEQGGLCLVVFFRAEKGTGSPCAIFGHADADLASSGFSTLSFRNFDTSRIINLYPIMVTGFWLSIYWPLFST